jgi:hypothetical protein
MTLTLEKHWTGDCCDDNCSQNLCLRCGDVFLGHPTRLHCRCCAMEARRRQEEENESKRIRRLVVFVIIATTLVWLLIGLAVFHHRV